MRRILFVIGLLLCARSAFAMEKYNGYCQQGGGTVTTAAVVSSTFVQRSFKVCTVTVYDPPGQTSTLATLYSDNGVTPLANPFTNQVSTTGQFFFYVAPSNVDIRIAATGLTTYTIGDVMVGYPGVLNCVGLPGATAGAKMTAALGQIASGGTADCRGLTGTISSTVSVGAGKTLLVGTGLTCATTSTDCVSVSGSGAHLVGLGRNIVAFTQASGSTSHPSIVAISASNVTVDGIGAVGAVYTGDEAAEEIACFHVVPVTNPQVITNVTIQNSSCTGKTSGIWTYNGANTFQLTSSQFLGNVIVAAYSGITIGGYNRAVYNSDILAKDNHSTVTVTTTFTGFYNARPCNSFNTNGMRWINNRCLGGFSGVEYLTYPASPRAKDVQFIGNVSDGHNGFTQIDGGVYANNIVDMTLRDAAWITYDNTNLVSGVGPFAGYGNLAGVELADNNNISATGNAIRGQMGPCVDFSSTSSTFTGNDLYDCSKATNHSANWPSYSGCLLINYSFTDMVISKNTISTCATSGIQQVGIDVLAALITRATITGNTIRNAQYHCVHTRNIIDSTISDNIMSGCNLAAGGYNGIDFTTDGGGATYQVSGVTASNNRIGNATALSGGAYCIYQPYVDAASNRLTYVTYNVCQSPTTQAFKFWGHRKGNWNASATGRRIITAVLAGNHVDLSDGLDSYDVNGVFSIEFLDNVTENDEILFQATTGAATTFVNLNGRLQMSGAVNYIPTATSYVRFIIRNDATATAEQADEIGRAVR